MKQHFDQEVRNMMKQENVSVPANIHLQTEQILDSLPEKETNIRFRFIHSVIKPMIIVTAC